MVEGEFFDVWVTSSAGQNRLAGRIAVSRGQYGNAHSSVFQYHSEFLETGYPLSPDLPLVSRPLHFDDHQDVPGAFDDAAPDTWGKKVTERVWSRNGTRPPWPGTFDYVLAVSDASRLGNLRISRPGVNVFLAPDPLVELQEDNPLALLADSARRLDASGAIDEDTIREAATILRAGSSLGGARPKITSRRNGTLYLAKFRASSDDADALQWEALAITIGKRSGIQCSESHVVGDFALVSKRFDRTARGRIGYISAHTLMELSGFDETPPYIELVEAMRSRTNAPRADYAELFRRITLFIALNNCDDHSRNHGFLRLQGRWRLAPMFDVVPEFRLGIRGTPLVDRGVDDRTLDELLGMHSSFGLSLEEAKGSFRAVAHGLSEWRDFAAEVGIGEIDDTVFVERFERARSELTKLAQSAI